MKLRAWVLGGILTAAAAAALHADWIVTRQGERFEIRGAWQLKGRLVVFHLPDGTLSSMRADRVDLDASKRLTQEAEKAAAAPAAGAAEAAPSAAKPKRKAVIVLTDKDFTRAPSPAPGGADSGKSAADKAKAGPPESAVKQSPATREVPSSVEVVTFSRVPLSESKVDGVEIKGTLRNKSQEFLTQVAVDASFFDDGGTFIARVPATIEKQALPPAESSAFTVAASGMFSYATIRWETHGSALKDLQGAKAPPPVKPQSR